LSIIRAVLISKALVQQGSVETLYQHRNGNSLEQIAGFTVVAGYRRYIIIIIIMQRLTRRVSDGESQTQ